jgi:hypothetical protein
MRPTLCAFLLPFSAFLHNYKASTVPYGKKPVQRPTMRFCRECFQAALAVTVIRQAKEIIL